MSDLKIHVLQILQPVRQAFVASKLLGTSVLQHTIGQLDAVKRENPGASKIYGPFFQQAATAFEKGQAALCQAYLTHLAARVALSGGTGGAVGQIPNVEAGRTTPFQFQEYEAKSLTAKPGKSPKAFGTGMTFALPNKTSPRAFAEHINAESQKRYGRDAIYPGLVERLSNDVPKTPTRYHVVLLVEDSNKRERYETYNKREGQAPYVKQHGYCLATLEAAALGAGLKRLSNNADPFNGNWVRIERDERSGVDVVDVLNSDPDGVNVDYCRDIYVLDFVFAAASPNLERKKREPSLRQRCV